MARPKVIITRKLPEAAEARARTLFDVELNAADTQLDAAGLARAMREADGLIPCVADKITAELLATPGRKARIVANYGVGYNNIDVVAAKANGVVVTNTPDVLTEDTADLALTLMLATARRAGEGERELRSGKWTGWRPMHMLATQVHGKTLGLIGIGRIGRAVARPIRPIPMSPSVLPCTCVASMCIGRQPVHLPLRNSRSPSPARRAVASISVSARSAVSSVSTSGVFVTTTSFAFAATTSMLL